jgi:hypothetical protein
MHCNGREFEKRHLWVLIGLCSSRPASHARASRARYVHAAYLYQEHKMLNPVVVTAECTPHPEAIRWFKVPLCTSKSTQKNVWGEKHIAWLIQHTRCGAPFGCICLMMYRLASLFLMLCSPRSVSAACIYAWIHILGVLFTYRLASLLLMLISPRAVSAACVYASIYALGVLFTYRLASLFQVLFSPRGVSAECIYAWILYYLVKIIDRYA